MTCEHFSFITARKTKFAKVMFSQSVHWRGVSAPLHAGIHTPLGADTPQSRPPGRRHPPGANTPQEKTPPGADTPQEKTLPRSRHPPPSSRHDPRSRHPQSRNPPRPETPPLANTPLGADTPPPPPTVHAGRYGQQVGGTHPTGMHTCYI